MDIRSLELFVDLSHTLRFRTTARRCHLTPSALTRAIARLEDGVGQQLLERDRRSVRLTSAGVRFQQYAEDAIGKWQQFLAATQPSASSLRGELRLYCSVTASYCVLPRLLWRMRELYSEISITLRTGDAEHGIERVLDADVDAALVPVPDEVVRSVDLLPLTRTPLLLLGPVRTCPLQVRLSEQVPWTRLPLILPETGPARIAIEQWFKWRRIKPEIHAYASGSEAILSMTSLGLGLGIVPKLVADHAPRSIHVRPVEDGPDLKPYTIALCTRKQASPIVAALKHIAGEAPTGE